MDRTQLLVRKAKRGDTDAYGELIRIHKDYFYRNAFCYVKNVEQACDVFQEAVTVGMPVSYTHLTLPTTLPV